MKKLLNWFLNLFPRAPRYERLDLKFVDYTTADKLIRDNADGPEEKQWHLAEEEKTNHTPFMVYIERRRVIEEATSAAEPTPKELAMALEESLRLQSHYAGLLNQYDGGERITFDSVEAWIARLREIRYFE